MPGPSSAAVGVATGAAGLAVCGLCFWNAEQMVPLVVSLGAGAAAMLALGRADRRSATRGAAREVTMAIVPWGVVVDPDVEPRILRWPAIRRVDVDLVHRMEGGTPAVVASLVTVETAGEVLAGRSAGAVGLERLMANLEAYAEEASRPVSGDLDESMPLGDATEPVVAILLRHAMDLCRTPRGAAELCLQPGGYRTVATATAAPETVAKLRSILREAPDLDADPRPLAAVVAALLGAEELVGDLLLLVSSPHPIVAAIAKAAAIRLGAPLNRAGTLDELASFLFADDLDAIRSWLDGEPIDRISAVPMSLGDAAA